MFERDRRTDNEPPHDTLAAEEFGIGTRFERWPAFPANDGPPHDTLAAEEFGIGTRDSRMPRDPTGYYTPHDILAAEAFPMPLPDRRGAMPEDAPRTLTRLAICAVAVLGLTALLLGRRRP
ncbi:MAG: hypothetical protein JW895_04595 [Thermoleophilaceae bacterium]|nr:hypothetical protein [Thermoleophilaceae bacterium]